MDVVFLSEPLPEEPYITRFPAEEIFLAGHKVDARVFEGYSCKSVCSKVQGFRGCLGMCFSLFLCPLFSLYKDSEFMGTARWIRCAFLISTFVLLHSVPKVPWACPPMQTLAFRKQVLPQKCNYWRCVKLMFLSRSIQIIEPLGGLIELLS